MFAGIVGLGVLVLTNLGMRVTKMHGAKCRVEMVKVLIFYMVQSINPANQTPSPKIDPQLVATCVRGVASRGHVCVPVDRPGDETHGSAGEVVAECSLARRVLFSTEIERTCIAEECESKGDGMQYVASKAGELTVKGRRRRNQTVVLTVSTYRPSSMASPFGSFVEKTRCLS